MRMKVVQQMRSLKVAASSLDRHGGGHRRLAHGVAEEGEAGDGGADGADDPSVDGGSLGGLGHELRVDRAVGVVGLGGGVGRVHLGGEDRFSGVRVQGEVAGEAGLDDGAAVLEGSRVITGLRVSMTWTVRV